MITVSYNDLEKGSKMKRCRHKKSDQMFLQGEHHLYFVEQTKEGGWTMPADESTVAIDVFPVLIWCQNCGALKYLNRKKWRKPKCQD